MLKYQNYNIVFQEIPNEITLAINLTNCPNGCKGCHSSYLQKNIGNILDEIVIDRLIAKYGKAISCICFMGGDNAPEEVEKLSLYIKKVTQNTMKTGWYSGKQNFPENCSVLSFDFLKLGPYIEALGGLDSHYTNQVFYEVTNGELVNKTLLFQKKKVHSALTV